MPYLAYIHLSYKNKPLTSGQIVTEHSTAEGVKRFATERAVRRLVDKKISSIEGYSITRVEWIRPIQGLATP